MSLSSEILRKILFLFSALIAMDNGETSQPICAYMSEEIIGEYALANTTLRELGLTSGTAVIR